MFKFWHKLNYLYSIVWIAATRTYKFEYREKSKAHKYFINKMSDYMKDV